MMFVMWEISYIIIYSLYADAHSFSCLLGKFLFKENIGKLCKIRVQSKQRFLQVEQSNIKSGVT